MKEQKATQDIVINDVSFDELMNHSEEQKKRFKCSVDNLFGYILFLFRTELGLSQERMGLVLAVMSKSSYNKLENGIYSSHISHTYMLSNLTNVPRKFINDLLDHLTDFCVRNNALLYVGDELAVLAAKDSLEGRDQSDIQSQHYQMRESLNTPLKDYPAFFGVDHISKLSAAINKAIQAGGKIEPRKL